MAKETMHISFDPSAGPAIVEALRAGYNHGTVRGVNFLPLRGGIKDKRVKAVARSRIVQYLILVGGAACGKDLVPDALPLPETTGTTDADRLARAMVGAGVTSPKALAEQLGYKDKASVQNVKTKGMKLSGRLLAWVEAREAEERT